MYFHAFEVRIHIVDICLHRTSKITICLQYLLLAKQYKYWHSKARFKYTCSYRTEVRDDLGLTTRHDIKKRMPLPSNNMISIDRSKRSVTHIYSVCVCLSCASVLCLSIAQLIPCH